ncbi:probable starch synthase 4, chloroplastic/amyloplastic [Macadamia integrifolia]|uniref:probable starch synthase 4, chloroplastic/amyloplastic n=1 Tax=Macadamia integrifolia TaxID=60698 RepID=UPI001C4EC82F|nr:probable starch synthase 4, chloroplastic/amyloplastic [Macadamia integrifolia]
MATKLSALYVGHGWRGFSSSNHSNLRLPVTPARFLPFSFKNRQRIFSSQRNRQQAIKFSHEPPPLDEKFQTSDDEYSEVQCAIPDTITSSPEETTSTSTEVDNGFTAKNTETTFDSSVPVDEKSTTENGDGGGKLSNVRLEDLIGMIRNAEKNILLLNQARVRALEDLENILSEKEALKGEISILEMRLADDDARIKVASTEKIPVEVLEDQLEKLKNNITGRREAEESGQDVYEDWDQFLKERAPLSHDNSLYSLSEVQSISKELRSLRTENVSLKEGIQELKAELNNIMEADERLLLLEKERSSSEAALKDLESKLVAAQADVSKLSYLQFECMDLREKIESLQGLLYRSTEQADQAISALQENHELRKKVDRLEESLQETHAFQTSSDNKHDGLMQQKFRLLEELVERSDQKIHSNIELYQQSVKEFQDTLNSIQEESKKKAEDGPVDDMPWEFWSRLLLIIDGLLLEKKISSSDASLLREMAWKRDGRICDAYLACKDKSELETRSTFLRLTSIRSYSPVLHIIHIAAEMAPIAKVGGLGDVVAGLSKALQNKGHLVEIILPKYDCMQYDRIGDLRALDVALESHFDGQLFKNKVWVGTVEGLPVYFIEPLHPAKFFWRGNFYGEHDDFKRFSFFSRAALELLLQAGKKPDIIHCHDWQTAFVAPLYWDLYFHKGLDSARICFTCHNFEYQGTASASELASCGLDVHRINRPDRMQDSSSQDRVNAVKGAIVFSNIVTTVSPTYAQEVRTAEGGHGLHATLNTQSRKFIGILNGIDTDTWDPRTDTFLKVQYGADDLQRKAENKEALRKHLKLSYAEARQPLVGCITRLVPQKGIHLIRHAIYRTVELGGQFVLLGSSPVPHIQKEFEGIANQFQNNPHVRLILKYDEALSHAIYAASDMFIIPSIFEPCGLTQMIAMRYGSVPVVRKTGGLNDSVFDLDDDSVPLQIRNGFTFLTPNEQGVNGALDRAFDNYMNDSESWQQLVKKNMKTDFSWNLSAAQYEDLYAKAITKAREKTTHT